MSEVSYTARWILPAAGPPVPNGVLVVRDGKVEAVLPKGERTPDVDLGNVALIPGLVNAHTHLDLSGARGKIPPTDPGHFTDWLKGVIAYRKARTLEEIDGDVRDGLTQCLRAGTTLVGDIASEGQSYGAVGAAMVRAVLFWELISLSAERFREHVRDFEYNTGRAGDLNEPRPILWDTDRLRWSVSPHAPYSANHSLTLDLIRHGGVATHLAESAGERELLESKLGPFVDFLMGLSLWDDRHFTHKFADFLADPDGRAKGNLYVHGNHLSPDVVVPKRDTLVYCPRTHAAFGHPPHPFREFMKRGVRVCLGTDSLASNPDLDILAEARFVKQRYPDFDGETLLKMVTLFGAEALGWADECGSLEPGKSADAVAVPLPDREGDPYDLLFGDDTGGERKTMFRGEWRS